MSGRAAALRDAFDSAFAAPAAAGNSALWAFLAIGVGGAAHAIEVAQISGLYADKPVTRLPGSAPEFLGVAGFRGVVLPVYDLRTLLGQPPAGAPRWLVTAAALPVAFAFDAFDGHLRLPPEAIMREDQDAGSARRALHAGGVVRPIVEITLLLDVVKARGSAQPGRQ